MKYLRYFKPEVLYDMVKTSKHNFLALGLGSNRIGLSVINTSMPSSFLVPTLESCDGNYKPNLLETIIKKNAIKETTLKVLTLQSSLFGLMLKARSSTLKGLIVSDLLQSGNPSEELSSLLMDYFRNDRIVRNMLRKKDSAVVAGEVMDGKFIFNPLFPPQILKLDEMSIGGVRNVLNKLIAIHNIGGLLISFDQRYWNNMKRYKYIEDGIRMLDEDGQLLQRSFTFVDDERSKKKVEKDICRMYPELMGVDSLVQKYGQMEEYNDRKQLSIDLTELRNAVRDSYATGYWSDLFYRTVRKNKLERNKYHKRKQEKMVKFAGSIGY